MMFIAYLFLQLVVGTGAIYMVKEAEEDLDKQNLWLILVCMLCAPLTIVGACGFAWLEKHHQKQRLKAQIIIVNWQQRAAEINNTSVGVMFYSMQSKEIGYQAMREAVNELSDKDLTLLSCISKNVYDMDPQVKEAVINELVDRELFDE